MLKDTTINRYLTVVTKIKAHYLFFSVLFVFGHRSIYVWRNFEHERMLEKASTSNYFFIQPLDPCNQMVISWTHSEWLWLEEAGTKSGSCQSQLQYRCSAIGTVALQYWGVWYRPVCLSAGTDSMCHPECGSTVLNLTVNAENQSAYYLNIYIHT